jgi:ketosteroid isomerase-like protein
MHKLLIALATALLATLPLGCASSSSAGTMDTEQAAVMKSIHQFVAGFNAGDAVKALEVCADQMSIIDEFPPFEWHGAGACAQWLADYDADAKKNGITDGVVTLGEPRHVDVAVDRAYVVAPADYDFKLKGKPTGENDSTFTFALKQSAPGWRITGWCWSKN